ncbi:MAG TPA: AAA family ATPase [Jiangellaceae bacterium]|nr:AAA family ATPase [Jiangellaceae bacterium]
MPAVDPVLASERAYLAQARIDLQRMREHTLSLKALGGDRVSEAYLAAALHRRAKSLADDPSVPLFFGRIDLDTDESFHIGRRHVMDTTGDPVVVDWRADISGAFYRATRRDNQGVSRRRRFGFAGGEITSYEDEHLRDTAQPDVTSRILTEEIERPRLGPMRDIVATIQPEQYDVVSAELDQTICVQGAPGTGKTAVGLHRAAFLLHAHRTRLARSGVLVVGPNRAFMHYIGQVLPALGEVDVRQVTVAELVESVPVHSVDPPDVASLKGDPRMAEVIHRAVWRHVGISADALVVPRGTRRWRVPASEVTEAIATLRDRGDPYSVGRALLPQRLAHLILLRMEASAEVTDDRVQDAIAKSRPVRELVDSVWPALDPVRLTMRLLGEPDYLADVAGDLLTNEERRLIRWARPVRGPRSAPWTHADAVLVDEARGAIERMPTVGHVVLDEAQDLSPMELRAVGRRAGASSATVLGDIAQGTTPWATESWTAALDHLGSRDAHVEVLRQGFRVPAAVVALSARLLPTIAPAVDPPEPVRANPGRLDIVPVDDVVAGAVAALSEVAAREGSVGLIAADADVPRLRAALRAVVPEVGSIDDEDDPRLALVPASLSKGLEFDHVIVVEPAAIAAAELRGLRRLYVVITRAVSSLTIVHAQPLPADLR